MTYKNRMEYVIRNNKGNVVFSGPESACTSIFYACGGMKYGWTIKKELKSGKNINGIFGMRGSSWL